MIAPGCTGLSTFSQPADMATETSAAMIVISQIQRLLWNVCQPVKLTLKLLAAERRAAAPPYHLKKNRKMKNRIALAPMI